MSSYTKIAKENINDIKGMVDGKESKSRDVILQIRSSSDWRSQRVVSLNIKLCIKLSILNSCVNGH